MKNKDFLYNELCKEIRQCKICQNIDFTPHIKNSNSFVNDKETTTQSYINLWNRWQGSLNAEIMLIGQDFGVYSEKFFATDNNLKKMFVDTFGINIDQSTPLLFFTNIANCYRKSESTGIINSGCLALCANKFMARLINIISPKIIIVLGKGAFDALACCDNAKLVCENPSDKYVESTLKNIIKYDYSLQFTNGNTIPVFPVYHPGANGQRNRTYDEQLQDWQRIFNCAENLNLEISKLKGKKHMVHHHNMFGPSCEVAGINSEKDFHIYCYKEHKVCNPNCHECNFFAGDESGKGICCDWEEYYSDIYVDDYAVQNEDTYKEFKRIEKLLLR